MHKLSYYLQMFLINLYIIDDPHYCESFYIEHKDIKNINFDYIGRYFNKIIKLDTCINGKNYIQLEIGNLTNLAENLICGYLDKNPNELQYYLFDEKRHYYFHEDNYLVSNQIGSGTVKRKVLTNSLAGKLSIPIDIFNQGMIMYYSAIEKIFGKGYCCVNILPYEYTNKVEEKILNNFSAFHEIHINLVKTCGREYLQTITAFNIDNKFKINYKMTDIFKIS